MTLVNALQEQKLFESGRNRMNIKNLSLKKIVGDDWIYNPDFRYADFDGSAELHKGDHIILFSKKNERELSAVSLQAVGLCDKKLIQIANEILSEIGINLRMGDSRNRIVKNFGTPDYIDCIEEGYYRYLDYDCYYTENFLITRYHYLLAPDLLICFGVPKEHYQKLTDLEIVNDVQMVSDIMKKRTACKESGNEVCPCKDRLSLVHQAVENRKVEGIQSEIVLFLESEIKNCRIESIQSKELDFFKLKMIHCTIEGMQSEYLQFSDCVFENVEFKNHYKKIYCSIERCIFKNCILQDTFEIGSLYVVDNQFQDCLFDGIRIQTETEGAYLVDNHITNCIFQNIDWVGYGFCSNIMRGGKIVHVTYYEHSKIEENQFSDMTMEEVVVKIDDRTFFNNEFNYVTLKDMTLKGQMGDNKFIDCNVSGFSIIGEKYMLKTVKEIINKRAELYKEDDYGIEKCRNELIEILSKDELLTIDILNQLDDEEIAYTSEVFEEIAYHLQSVNYIDCLEKIYIKYPHLNIKDAIEVAKEFTDM